MGALRRRALVAVGEIPSIWPYRYFGIFVIDVGVHLPRRKVVAAQTFSRAQGRIGSSGPTVARRAKPARVPLVYAMRLSR